jgi:acyl-CoA synthetase (AMP-forming)/AMP-acid ligase II
VTALADRIFSLRDRPQVIYGFWTAAWRILEIGRERGIPDGSFHPDTIVQLNGGLKGLDLPEDYLEQVTAFFGTPRLVSGYGMTELAFGLGRCAAGKYHAGPAHILMILDETGEHLRQPGADGRVTGRVAFHDVGHEGHWGGIVTGDRATADFSPTCSCGRIGPTLDSDIVRYSEINGGGDDKLTCGGTIDAYIRGAVGS